MLVASLRWRHRLLTVLTLASASFVPAAALADPAPVSTPVPAPTTPVNYPAPTPVPAPAAPKVGIPSFAATYPGGAAVPLSVQTNGDQVYLNAPKTAVEDASKRGCVSLKVKIPLQFSRPTLGYSYAEVAIGNSWVSLEDIGNGVWATPDWWFNCLYQPQGGAITLSYGSWSFGPPYTSEYHTVPLGQFTLIDPAGTVYDQTLYDAAIAHGADPRSARGYAAVGGASVELQAKGRDGAFHPVSQLDPALLPAVNPETTPTYGAARGQFAWRSTSGVSYRAVVTAAGYDGGASATVEADPTLTGMHVALHAVCPNGETPDYGGIADYPTTSGSSDYPTYPTWDYPTSPGTSTYPVYVGYPNYPGYPLDYPGSTKLPFSCHGVCPTGQVGVPPNCHDVAAPPTPSPAPTPTPVPQAPQSGTTNPPVVPTPKPTPKPVAPKPIQIGFKGKVKVVKGKRTVTFTCSAASAITGATCKVTVALGKKKSGSPLLKSTAKLKGTSKAVSLTFTKKAWAKARKNGKVTITLVLVGPTGSTISTVTKTISVG